MGAENILKVVFWSGPPKSGASQKTAEAFWTIRQIQTARSALHLGRFVLEKKERAYSVVRKRNSALKWSSNTVTMIFESHGTTYDNEKHLSSKNKLWKKLSEQFAYF